MGAIHEVVGVTVRLVEVGVLGDNVVVVLKMVAEAASLEAYGTADAWILE